MPEDVARATWITASRTPPRSRTVVTPWASVRSALRTAFTAAAAGVGIARASAAKSAVPSKHRCTCASISPGESVQPDASTTDAARATRGARACGPTHSIAPAPISTPVFARTRSPSNTVASAR
jgi:hypothetical protein